MSQSCNVSSWLPPGVEIIQTDDASFDILDEHHQSTLLMGKQSRGVASANGAESGLHPVCHSLCYVRQAQANRYKITAPDVSPISQHGFLLHGS